MKTLTIILLTLIVCSSTVFSQTARSANPPKFFIGGYRGNFDNGTDTSWAQNFGLLGATGHRYTNLEPQDDSLGLNCEDREFYDNPSDHPAVDSMVLGGKSDLDVLVLQPFQLFHAVQNTFYTRFEFERHQLQSPANEYAGFLYHSGLTGRDTVIDSATSPLYLVGTSRATDTNALVLDTAMDSAGVFADSIWHNALFEGAGDDHPYFGYNRFGAAINRKMLLRMRVKVTQNVDTTNPPILCIVTRTEKCHLRDTNGNFIPNSYALRLTHIDTIVVNSQFKHINSDFDTIDLRFKRDSIHTGDSTTTMYFSFSWPKQVSAVFDYMELMTAHIDSTDNPDSLGLGWDHPPSVASEAGAYSAEDFLAPNPVELIKLVSRIKSHYLGHINYIRMGDEFPIGQALPLKRLAKLIHDSTGGQIEMLTVQVDSGSWSDANNGIPRPHVYDFESARLGWVDDSMYYDEKMVIADPYVIQDVALPIRTKDTAHVQTWENTFAPVRKLGTTPTGEHYSRDSYLSTIQKEYNTYLNANRHLRRWTERQHNGSHYGIDWQDYTNVVIDSTFLAYDESRPPTGAEMKVTGHLAVSNGAAGLFLYPFVEPPPGSAGGLYGGTVLYDGTHDSMYYSTSVSSGGDTVHGRLWLGFKEKFDTLQKLLPLMKIYGNDLIKDTCLGDWTAAELPNAPSGAQSMLPFVFNSMVALSDSGQKDLLVKNDLTTNNTNDSNRTFVHISMWLDKDSTAKALHQDTLLYITNMRSDDSYDTTAIPTTIDRRFITLRLKSRHLIHDEANPYGGELDNPKVITPFVDTLAGDSLKLQLLAGDGILIRLMSLPDSTHAMRAMINFPKGGVDFNDKGRIRFDRPIIGVKNNVSDFSIPSSHLNTFTVIVPDTTTSKLWQDSLIYQRVDSVGNSRNGYWRQQNFTVGTTTKFKFQDSLAISSAPRLAEVSTDSVAHNIVIKTDLEGTGSGGVIGFTDPFLVDSATLKNVLVPLNKTSPFLPHTLNPGRMPGVDSQHYGGIFLFQNETHNSGKPIYTLTAHKILKAGTLAPQDTGTASAGDWVFLYWASNDTIDASDTKPWQINPYDTAFPLMNMNPKPDVVFSKDSAQYIARYHCHLSAFNSGTAPNKDSGLSWNDQRKLYFTGFDSHGRRTYRMVYASRGRIFTATGFRTGIGNTDIIWNSEQCVSEYGDTNARYPSMSGHRNSNDTSFYYLYQKNDGDHTDIILSDLDTNGVPELDIQNDTNAESYYAYGGALDATPVIFGITGHNGKPIEVLAWSSLHDGINLEALYNWGDDSTRTSTEPLYFSDSIKHPRHPAVWIDTAYSISGTTVKYHVTVAWQQDTTMDSVFRNNFWTAADTTYTDVFVVTFDLIQKPFVIDTTWSYDTTYDNIDGIEIPTIDTSFTIHIPDWFYFDTLAGENQLHPKDISYLLKGDSYDNRNPCITGTGYDTNTSKMRIAFETSTYDAMPGHPGFLTQGISVIQRQMGGVGAGGWVYTKYFQTSDTLNDKYQKPSIEITRSHDSSGATVHKSNYYSLAYEKTNGRDTKHWGMDGPNPRIAASIPTTFTGVSNPQLSVVRESIDSNVFRMGINPANPHVLTPAYAGLSEKVVGNDTIWNYIEIEEPDSARSFYICHGAGEYTVDNGITTNYLEFIDRSDTELIDASHSAGYFTQSENFTLPASGSFSYFRWLSVTDTALYKTKFDSIEYALDFFDTTGAFVYRLDSLYLSDSTALSNRGTKTISVDRDNDAYGYVRFIRITNCLPDSGKIIPIITEHPASNTSYKKAMPLSSGGENIPFTAEPNPTQGDVKLTFTIPTSGVVSLEAYNELGLKVSEISESRYFSDGEHHLYWHPHRLSEGTYYIHLNYGNLQKVLRVIYQR
jgi:hypothetical protein